MSLDGKTATRTGSSRWISSTPSRELVHTIRGQMDAVLVGIGTVLHDDPLLTARPPGPRKATRVVADSLARLPLDSCLVQTAREVPVLAAATDAAPARRRAALEEAGVEVLVLPAEGEHVSLKALLEELGRRSMTNVLLEGGGELCAAALSAGLVDKLLAFVAPKIVGGRDAPTPVEGQGVAEPDQALRIKEWTVRRVGEEALLEAWL
jgi:diaminohydroxyphosphoribosylaminopyrimidine deaminase/5-amino-6-(5-phosphoribosylamino)uracil reductase